MTEQKKLEEVINDLKCCLRKNECSHCGKCSLRKEDHCRAMLRDEVINLLLVQQPVEPIMRRVVFEYDTFSEAENKMYCPKCKMELLTRVNYCPKCGQAVKWK